MSWFGGVLLMILVILHYTYCRKGFSLLYVLALSAKLFAGVTLGWIYIYHYDGGDTWNYFNEAIHFNKVATQSASHFIKLYILNQYELVSNFLYTGQPRAALMLKVVGLFNVITGNNYWLTSMYLSFISFTGIWAFVFWAHKSNWIDKTGMLLLLFWPSLLFWSSGVLKESISIFAMLWLVLFYFRLVDRKANWQDIGAMAVCLALLFFIKYYIVAVLLPVIMAHYVVSNVSILNKNSWISLLGWMIVLFTGIAVVSTLHPNFYWDRFMEVIVSNHNKYIAISDSDNIIHFHNLSPNIGSLLFNAPLALWAGLFLPLNFNGSILSILASIENWMLIGLFLWALFKWGYSITDWYRIYIYAAISFIMIQAIFLSLSTPNLGTLVRYKVAFLPFVLVLLGAMIKKNS